MQQTREIPRQDWAKYLAALSTREKDHPVHIEVESTDMGEQVVAERLPLVGLSLVEKGSDKGEIEVTIGDTASSFTHRIAAPEHVYIEESESGALECLDIEDQAHAKTLISFQCQGMPHGKRMSQ